MSKQIKAYIEDSIMNLLWWQLSAIQGTDHTGYPSSKPVVQSIKFTYKTKKSDPFLEKMISGKITDFMEFVIAPTAMNSKSTRIRIQDVYVKVYQENFDGVNNRPMTTYIEATFATLIVNDVVMDVKNWNVTDPYPSTVKPTVINQEEKEFTRCYLTNTANKKIQDYSKDEIIVVNLETSNRIGDVITINLDDAEYDFEYNGNLLPNDTLNNIVIQSDLEQIELKVIEQKKTD